MKNKMENLSDLSDPKFFGNIVKWANLDIPQEIEREGTSREHPEYNKLLKILILKYLIKKRIIDSTRQELNSDQQRLFDNIYASLKNPYPEEVVSGKKYLKAEQQQNLFFKET